MTLKDFDADYNRSRLSGTTISVSSFMYVTNVLITTKNFPTTLTVENLRRCLEHSQFRYYNFTDEELKEMIAIAKKLFLKPCEKGEEVPKPIKEEVHSPRYEQAIATLNKTLDSIKEKEQEKDDYELY